MSESKARGVDVNSDDVSLMDPLEAVIARVMKEQDLDQPEKVIRATLKALEELGFTLTPRAGERRASMDVGAAQALLRQQLASESGDLNGLLLLWRERDKRSEAWEQADAYEILARRLLHLGSPVTALEVLAEARERFVLDARKEDDENNWPVSLRRLRGFALARAGAMDSANRVLTQVFEEGNRDADTYGNLAMTHKNLGFLAVTDQEQRTHLKKSFQVYSEGYERYPEQYWLGINAASLGILLDDPESAKEFAKRVIAQCTELAKPGVNVDSYYWLFATLGEASLVLGEWSAAEGWFRRAMRFNQQRFGDVNSTRRQARLLLKKLGQDTAMLDRSLPMPRVIVFAGHMMDEPDRPSPRFPPELVGRVKDAIHQKLLELGDHPVGFSAAANGADILFQECLQDLQGESHIVLPFEPDTYSKELVDVAGASWKERYRGILDKAFEVVITSRERVATGQVSFEYADKILQGLALVRAQEFESEVIGLFVLDKRKGKTMSGTEMVVNLWKKRGARTEIIDLAAIRKAAGIQTPETDEAAPSRSAALHQKSMEKGDARVMCMIFGDAVGFSKLSEQQVPRFVDHFLGTTAALLKAYTKSVAVKNTWGDGLYLVFKSVRDAGLFALDLAEAASRSDRWQEVGLPREMNARIALHAGPVFPLWDPVIEQTSYTGTHVSRTARMEPVASEGEVYASQAFAALTCLEGVKEFRCEFVKLAKYAKNYGTFPAYVLRRSRPSEGSNHSRS